MRKRLTAAALLAVAAITGSAIAWHTAGASGGEMTADLEVFVLQSDPAVVDVLAEGNGPGDWLVWYDPVFDADGNEIGTAFTRVQILEAVGEGDFSFILDCTIALDGGNVVFTGGGLMSQLPAVPFAVVGGTGEYAGVTGSLSGQTIEQVGGQPTFRLPFDFVV